MTDQPTTAPRITTGSARRGGNASQLALAGSPRTAWSRHLDQPGVSTLGLVVAGVLGVAALAAAIARAVENPAERLHHWWVPVAVLGGACLIPSILTIRPNGRMREGIGRSSSSMRCLAGGRRRSLR